MDLILIRKYKTIDRNGNMPQTLGKLYVNDGERTNVFKTIESLYFKNIKKISCVKPGVYQWKKVKPNSKVPFDHIQIITDRPDVSIRAGIDYLTLAGSIVVGKEMLYNQLYDMMQVSDSKETFKELMSLVPSEGTINIIDERITVRSFKLNAKKTASVSNFWYDINIVPLRKFSEPVLLESSLD